MSSTQATATPDYLEIVVNTRHGGFGLSDEAKMLYGEPFPYEVERTDPKLVEIVKKLGDRANGDFAELRVQRIPRQYTDFYRIDEEDGWECVVVEYDKYKIHQTKCILQDLQLTQTERITRAVAMLEADLQPPLWQANEYA